MYNTYIIYMVSRALNSANDSVPQFNTLVFDLPKATVDPYLNFDSTTDRIILHNKQVRYDETYTPIANYPAIAVLFKERPFDVSVGLQYKYVSSQGDTNYPLRVIHNNSGLASTSLEYGQDPSSSGVAFSSRAVVLMVQ